MGFPLLVPVITQRPPESTLPFTVNWMMYDGFIELVKLTRVVNSTLDGVLGARGYGVECRCWSPTVNWPVRLFSVWLWAVR